MLNLFKRQKPQETFTESISLTNSMKALVASTNCPACGHLTLGLVRTEQGKKAFETEVNCGNCNFSGISNSLGFQFNRVNSKGRAKE